MEDKLPPLHPMYGKHHSEESKKKISEAMKGNKNNKGKHWKWHEKDETSTSRGDDC